MGRRWLGLSLSASTPRSVASALAPTTRRFDSPHSGAVLQVRYRATVAYDGTDFLGFQSQEHASREVRTVQSVLEAVIRGLVGHSVRVVGAGRTDAGVHASGQVVHFDLPSALSMGEFEFERAANALLPDDVRVFGVAVAPDHFHARFSATARSYRYLIENSRFSTPHLRRCAWHVTSALDVEAMQAACESLIGLHDFVAFAAREGSGPTVRRMVRARVVAGRCGLDSLAEPGSAIWHNSGYAFSGWSLGGRIISIEFEANAFLRHMVRRIVGSLVRVGRGWLSATEVGHVLRTRAKAGAGPAAPAHGLDLFRVAYDDATMVDMGRRGSARE